MVSLLPSMIAILLWWLDSWTVCAGVPFSRCQPSVSLVTNTLTMGWGGSLEDPQDSGTLVPKGALVTHQCEGTEGGAPSLLGVPTPLGGQL